MIKVTRSAVIDVPIDTVWAILRDFNSHWAWHPAVGDSEIENGEASDQVGCVRNFYLKDGNHIREQLLTLSDHDFTSTYCILDATLPMRRYVATVQLKPVTDGNRTFWHWQSTFDVPRGREREFEQLVGNGVYEGGFSGLRAFLRAQQRGDAQALLDRGVLKPAAQVRVRTGADAAGGAAMPGHGVFALRHGGTEVLDYRSIEAPAPGAGEVRIRQRAVGVNYIDVYIRKGQYPMIKPPAMIGMEAAGEVIDVGPDVAHLLPGDRVAYAAPMPGAYCTIRTLPAAHLVLLPPEIGDVEAAALMLKGMTAEYLLHRTCRVQPGDAVLVHAAAGGVGLMLCQWAHAIGAQVLGTVSSEDKARVARANGCDVPIVTRNYRFADTVLAATGGRGAAIIYDGLGREAFEENLRAIAPIGHWVSYGQASGPHDAIQTERLSSKSLTLTRPVLFHYTAQRATLEQIAQRTFAAVRDGLLKLDVRHRYPLATAAQAHADLESRSTVGPIVLLP
jgi:NADPH:quinone reductase-like Zn-dependent oxidoreductase